MLMLIQKYIIMLPTTFTDRFKELMSVKIEDLEAQARNAISRRSAEWAARGIMSPNSLHGLRHENAVWLTTHRIQASLEAIQKVALAQNLPYSESLATDLKALLQNFTSETWCKQLIDNYDSLDNQQRGQYDRDLLQKRGIALNRTNAEIDLLVDSIKTRSQATQVQTKELEQKFKILLSARQAPMDFDEWAKELGATSGAIAILFVDIDNFKLLNTRHTETVIDETILPDAMQLIRGLTHLRGGAYRQGGEEFLVILPNIKASEAYAFGEKLRSTFESTSFKVKEQVEQLTVSIGIAVWPQHGSSYNEVLKAANREEAAAKLTRNACRLAKD